MEKMFHDEEVIIELKKNEILFHDYDILEHVYYVIDGFVKIIKYTEEGNEKIIDLLGPKDFIAVTLLMENRDEYGLNGIVVKDCKLIKVSSKGMLEALTNLDTLKQYMDFQSRKTLHFKNYISISSENDEKLIGFLNGLASRFGKIENDVKVLDLPINKTDLANFIGMRRETLSRKLSNLTKQGILKVDKNKIYLKM
ncbi:Crp/Fnr family transcriptional regulator [Mycoplasmatota bacterium WC44]